MVSATVMMSTYNGEKFIREQIDSILNQTFQGRIKIVIRDDGSSDNTREIIEEYKTGNNRIIELIKGDNIGPQKSFLSLIRCVDNSDFYFFADQDDIWYPNKIQQGIDMLQTVKEPACYCSNYDIYFSKSSTYKKQIITKTPDFTPIKVIMYNQIPGCVMGFNHLLMKILKKLDLEDVMMHDSMVLSLAVSTGVVIYDQNSSIAHRIHGDNVIGEGHKKIKPIKWIKDKASLIKNKESYDISQMSDEFLKTGNIKAQWVNDLSLLRDYKKSWETTLSLLRHKDTQGTFGSRTTMSIRSKILLHLF